MNKFHQVIIDNIKEEPEFIIEENEDNLETTERECLDGQINQLIDDRVLCNFCNKLFNNLQILKAHQKFHHSGNYFAINLPILLIEAYFLFQTLSIIVINAVSKLNFIAI